MSAKTAKRKKRTARKASPTLADVATLYLAELESRGSSTTTIAGYRAELRRALDQLGDETPISALTPAKIRAFNRSAIVTKKRDGRQKSQRSIDRTRRVLRLALCHAKDSKLIGKAPLPEKD